MRCVVIRVRHNSKFEAVKVTVANRDELLADLAKRLRARRGFSVATLNLDHAVKLTRDPQFVAAYAAQTHVTADGNPIVWLSHLAGQREVRLVPGSELIDPVVALAAVKGVPIGLIGSTEATLKKTAAKLHDRYAGLEVTLKLAPPMGFDPDGVEADAAIAAIAESRARVIFLALGAPKQERFAARAQAELPAVGFLSIGAGIDFVSGRQQRAPKWVRDIAAEWVWRLFSDPGRLWKRYLYCMAIMPTLTLSALATRWAERGEKT